MTAASHQRPVRSLLSRLFGSGLQSRFYHALALVLLFFCAVSAILVYRHEKSLLEEHSFHQTQLVMAAAGAARKYVAQRLRPRMQQELGPDHFIIEAMSTSYVSRHIMEYFREEIPDFSYRRVSINARNPDFEANQLERWMIDYFRDHLDQSDWRGIAVLDGERVFMRFSPVIFDASCLACHGEPEQAHPYITERYGLGGFGKPIGIPAGVISITIPVEKGLAQIRETALTIFGGALLLMVFLYLAIVFFFNRLIVSNLRGMLALFRKNLSDDEGQRLLEQTRTMDEIGELSATAGLIADNLQQAQEQLRDRAQNLEDKARLERQLLQAQKMESVGRLAGSVAHDFNNMLQGILGYCDLVLLDMKPDDPHHEALLEIRRAAQSSASLTRQLLAFARQQPATPKVVDLNETTAGMLKMLNRLIGEEIELLWQPGKNLWPVKIDPSQVDQLLANLVVNARDAITGTGVITIASSNVTLDEAYCSTKIETGTSPGDYVRLMIRDNGCGMDEETVSLIFEPFFTTKDPGRGTGLGLATVYGIVRQNGGGIDLHSEPGHGTTFYIYLPRCPEEARPATAAESGTAAPMPGGHETILLVEDEKAILAMVESLLVRLGYTVLTAATPSKALQIANQHRDIDLLITDVMMPEMNGWELADRLAAIQPGMRCLYMSGYSAEIVSPQAAPPEGIHFIQKPFTLEGLARKIRVVLSNDKTNR